MTATTFVSPFFGVCNLFWFFYFNIPQSFDKLYTKTNKTFDKE